jgi:hypothetical protein
MSHFELMDDGTIIAHCRGGTKLDLEKAVRELNSLEEGRIKKRERIAKLEENLMKMNGVINGMESYFELKLKGVIW